MADDAEIAVAGNMLCRVAVAAHLTQRREFDSKLVEQVRRLFSALHSPVS